MLRNGLRGAGYNRINLDDCWSLGERAANGSLQWDPEKFPRGLPFLTAYLRELGFNVGIYADAGLMTCGGYPGSFGHEELDGATFSEWGFNYLKLDGCNMPVATEAEYKTVYGKWHEVLSNLTSPMVFSQSAPAYFAEMDNLTDWYTVMVSLQNCFFRYDSLRDIWTQSSDNHCFLAGWVSMPTGSLKLT